LYPLLCSWIIPPTGLLQSSSVTPCTCQELGLNASPNAFHQGTSICLVFSPTSSGCKNIKMPCSLCVFRPCQISARARAKLLDSKSSHCASNLWPVVVPFKPMFPFSFSSSRSSWFWYRASWPVVYPSSQYSCSISLLPVFSLQLVPSHQVKPLAPGSLFSILLQTAPPRYPIITFPFHRMTGLIDSHK
jgi:hypothetical protein